MTRKDLKTCAGHRLAVRQTPGLAGLPGFIWLSGFHSDMRGSKAVALQQWAVETGHPLICFDYFGHGESEGAFADGTISRWLEDTLEVIDRLADGPQVLVGSSMGGWIALLAALRRPHIVRALILIAPAVDFTEALMWARFPPEAKRQIEAEGRWMRPSAYGEEPYPITRALIEDGRRHLLLDRPIAFRGPVRVLQGMRDPDIPWEFALKLADRIESPDLAFTLVKDGDHRLSRPQDISRLLRTCAGLSADVSRSA